MIEEEKFRIENQVINNLAFAIPKPKTIEDACRLAVELTIDQIEQNFSLTELNEKGDNNEK